MEMKNAYLFGYPKQEKYQIISIPEVCSPSVPAPIKIARTKCSPICFNVLQGKIQISFTEEIETLVSSDFYEC
jgi:hypothetical protein